MQNNSQNRFPSQTQRPWNILENRNATRIDRRQFIKIHGKNKANWKKYQHRIATIERPHNMKDICREEVFDNMIYQNHIKQCHTIYITYMYMFLHTYMDISISSYTCICTYPHIPIHTNTFDIISIFDLQPIT